MYTYNLAPSPFWYYRNQLGLPLANGTMYAYRDTNRSEYKAVYSDPNGSFPYVQPIHFDASGGAGPFYWASDENYYLEFYDSNGTLIHTMPHFNAPQDGGIAPINSYNDFTNMISDPTFRYAFTNSITPLATANRVSNAGWYFEKGNTSATDKIELLEFTIGEVVPPENPLRYFRYECTIAGALEGYKRLEYRFKNVRTFQNQAITIQYYGRASASAPAVEVKVIQYFGTGGGPSPTVETPVTTHNLLPGWAQYQCKIVVPTVSGKTPGSNNDDYLSITFNFTTDFIAQIDLTNFQVNLGVDYLPFEERPNRLTLGDILPTFNAESSLDRGKVLMIDSNGILQWSGDGNLIGEIIAYATDATIPPGYLVCNGASLSTTTYADLFSVISYKWGGSGANFNIPDFRGVFLRGLDQGRGLDPGRALGNFQSDDNKAHVHTSGTGLEFASVGAAGSGYTAGSDAEIKGNATTASSGGTEARPVNEAVVYLIKATNS